MAKQELTCDDILKELKAKQYRPIYYLMGEESYYIDLIADYITDNVLNYHKCCQALSDDVRTSSGSSQGGTSSA